MIIFMGVAGSGKSVQGTSLASALGCPWIGVGNLLRSKLDEKHRQEMLEGKLLDDRLVFDVITQELAAIDAARQECILDGSPRTLQQAEWLHELVESGRLKITAIIHLVAPESAVRERLLKRGRPDDHDLAINERFVEYEQNVKPIIAFFKDHGYAVHDINGMGSEAEVSARIHEAIEHAA